MPWSFFFHGRDADGGLRKARNRGCEIMRTHYFTASVVYVKDAACGVQPP
jgi:hypothetical protein